MNAADIAAVRELITYAKANGWNHYIYGGSFGIEHLWQSPRPYRHYSEVVSLCDGRLSYREAGNLMPHATLIPTSAAKVTDWLRLLELIPTAVQVAEAILSDRAADAILGLIDMQRTGLLRTDGS